MKLLPSQQSALEHFRQHAGKRRSLAEKKTAHILRMSNIAPAQFISTVENIQSQACVAMHFHPDRLDYQMKSVAQSLLDCGIYRNQFETGLSNGSVSAHPGGDRDLWEKAMYGGSYHVALFEPEIRPKYGALDLLKNPYGPAPRFGSCFFVLKPEVTKRATLTYMDSNDNPEEKGTIDEIDDILGSLLSESFSRDFVLGQAGLSVPRLIEKLSSRSSDPALDKIESPSRNLDFYVEVQVHGDIILGNDVSGLVADPSFMNTPTGDTLKAIAEKYEFVLHWHSGYKLAAHRVPLDFRGPAMPSLARRIAENGFVDASLIGKAAVSLKLTPDSWADRGTYSEVLQELKLLWHVLVRFGTFFRAS